MNHCYICESIDLTTIPLIIRFIDNLKKGNEK